MTETIEYVLGTQGFDVELVDDRDLDQRESLTNATGATLSVWGAFTDPAPLITWMTPSAGLTLNKESSRLEVRPGAAPDLAPGTYIAAAKVYFDGQPAVALETEPFAIRVVRARAGDLT